MWGVWVGGHVSHSVNTMQYMHVSKHDIAIDHSLQNKDTSFFHVSLIGSYFYPWSLLQLPEGGVAGKLRITVLDLSQDCVCEWWLEPIDMQTKNMHSSRLNCLGRSLHIGQHQERENPPPSLLQQPLGSVFPSHCVNTELGKGNNLYFLIFFKSAYKATGWLWRFHP